MKHSTTVAAWNVKTGNPHAMDGIEQILEATGRPPIFELIEAAYLHKQLERRVGSMGYELYQEEPDPFSRKLVSEKGDVAVLVRKDVKVLAARPVAMTQPWVGPVNDWPHMPRRYWRVRYIDGIRWRGSFEHWATGGPSGRNGKAVQEAIQRGRTFLHREAVPRYVVGDLNMNGGALSDLYPYCQIGGRGPDHLIAAGNVAIETTRLSRFGSDHLAYKYVVTSHG